MAERLIDFLPILRRRLGMYVPRSTFLATCAFISGYQWGSDDDSMDGFHAWLVARGNGRPELAWPWLVLCEVFGDGQIPDTRHLTEQQDSNSVAALFDLLDEYFEHRSRVDQSG